MDSNNESRGDRLDTEQARDIFWAVMHPQDVTELPQGFNGMTLVEMEAVELMKCVDEFCSNWR